MMESDFKTSKTEHWLRKVAKNTRKIEHNLLGGWWFNIPMN